ncbi:MAG: CHRD domain-containing protein [Balneolales bacterium]|nr:CHRD domain-containing protein [Balneolales bacterium]
MKTAITMLMMIFLMAGFSSEAKSQAFTANLSGDHETHLVSTQATGSIEAMLDGNNLIITGSFMGLSSPVATEIAGGAHVHMGLAGQDGDVVLVLDANFDADLRGGSFLAEDNTFELSSEQLTALENRMLYVNIHTELFQAGELRGQLVPEADQVFRVSLLSSEEVPPVASSAGGAVIIELNDHDITVSGSFSGLSSPLATEIAGGAHIHLGFAGQNGDVAIVLEVETGDDPTSGVILAENNTFNLSHSQLMAMINRQLYVNIHSEMFQAGEIRGQILADNDAHFRTTLSGVSETHLVNTEARGAVVAELNGNMITFTGSFDGLSSPVATEIAGGAHVHMGLPGRDGDVKIVLDATLSSDGRSGVFERSNNTFELDTELATALFGRELYVNIHTEMNQPGEIRGQILPNAQVYFLANLDGLNENDVNGPVVTSAEGLISAELVNNRLTVSGSFNNLSSALATEIAGGAHIHVGGAGELGDVLFVLEAQTDAEMTSGVFLASENTFMIEDEAMLEALLEGGLYVNIHSEMFPSGELRGQLLAGLQFFADAPEILSPADGAEITIQGNPDTIFEVSWSESESMDSHNITYLWELAADADFETNVLFVNTGSSASFEATFEVLSMLLDDFGVLPGQSVELFHRAYASNGSVNSKGETASVIVTRGVLTNIGDENGDLPTQTQLSQNYPNPFNPTTQITFELAQSGLATLDVYNMLGQRVATLVNENMSAGVHTISFDASRLSSGTYIYRLTSDGFSQTRKMMLVK